MKKLVRWRLLAAGSAAFLLLASHPLAAQGTITGKVTAEGSGEPLADASILVLGTSASALTGTDGRFSLRNVREGTFDLQVLRVGYRGQKKSVTVKNNSTTNADFQLVVSVVELQAVVTTATGQQRRIELGNAVSTLGNVPKLVENSQVRTVSDILLAKSPGVVVLPNTMTGGAPSVRIRGTSSISLNNAPIFYVDGVRYATNDLQSGTDTQFSLLNSLNPEDIEDIEIVKGPSAATLYGTNAANGVVVITTKKGRAGTTRWNWLGEAGSVNDRVPYPQMYANFGHNPSNPTRAIRCQLATMTPTTCVTDSVTHYNYLRDPERTFLKDGNRQLYGGNVQGGTELVRFFVSGDFENEIGPIEMPGYEIHRFDSLNVKVLDQWKNPLAMSRKSFRANLSAALNPKLDLSLSTGFGQLYNRIPPSDDLIIALLYVGIQNYGYKGCPAGTETTGCGLDKLPKQVDGTPLNDAFQFAPGDIMQNINESTVGRTTLSSNANWRPLSWLQADGTVGMDLSASGYYQICRLQECPPANATARAGRVTDNKRNFRNLTGKVSSTSTWNLRPWLNLKTSVGGDYNNIGVDFVQTNGVTLPPGASTVASATTRAASQQQPTAVKTLGLYVQEQVALRDRMFITAAMRTDQNSAFGTNFQSVYYPKASLSWLLSDESLFPHFNWLNSFRFRTAYGASGVQPGATASLILFTPSTVAIAARGATTSTDVPSLSPSQPGNANLKPEKSTEFESGFETQMINNRVRVDFTYYRKQTKDALIAINLAPSSAASQLNPLQNIGSTRNWGQELTLSAQLYDTRRIGWDVQVNASHNSSKVVDLGIDPNTGKPRILRTTSSGGEIRQVPGLPVNSQFWRPYTYKDQNGDGILQVAEVVVDSAFKYFGYRTPRDLISVQSGFDLFSRRLRVNASFDHKGGGGTVDGANNFQCTTGPFACQETQDPKAPLANQARAVAKTYGTVIGGTSFKTTAGYWMSNDFWKWRELSAILVLPSRLTGALRAQNGSTLVFAARNLRTWTDFTGYDPEANYGLSQSDGQNEFQTHGAPKYYTLRVNLKY